MSTYKVTAGTYVEGVLNGAPASVLRIYAREDGSAPEAFFDVYPVMFFFNERTLFNNVRLAVTRTFITLPHDGKFVLRPGLGFRGKIEKAHSLSLANPVEPYRANKYMAFKIAGFELSRSLPCQLPSPPPAPLGERLAAAVTSLVAAP